MKKKTSWNIKTSDFALNSINPIRDIMEKLNASPNPDKSLIPLSIGDPTLFGNLLPCDSIIEAIVESAKSNKYNGYLPSMGLESAKQAIAKYSSIDKLKIDSKDVIITSGCSQALEMCFLVLANPGSNVLIPKPGFPLYKTLCSGPGIKVKQYNLKIEQNWKIDIDHLESLIDSKTAAIVYNNPSNPCGSVYSEDHIKELLKIAQKYCIPIIADEIYQDMIFPGSKFLPIASLTNEVPILSCRGVSKRFLLPGYRCGWIIIYDRYERFGLSIRQGLSNLSQRIVGCNSLIQGALPKIFAHTPDLFFEHIIFHIRTNAEICFNSLSQISGIRPIMPKGAMYLMASIDLTKFVGISSDLDFVEKLLNEESVFLLPGVVFDIKNFVRIVLTVQREFMEEACKRITKFCSKYSNIKGTLSKSSNAISTTNLITHSFAIE